MPDTFRIVVEDGLDAEERSADEWKIERIVGKIARLLRCAVAR
jgi:hypothetical protein